MCQMSGECAEFAISFIVCVTLLYRPAHSLMPSSVIIVKQKHTNDTLCRYTMCV